MVGIGRNDGDHHIPEQRRMQGQGRQAKGGSNPIVLTSRVVVSVVASVIIGDVGNKQRPMGNASAINVGCAVAVAVAVVFVVVRLWW